MNKMIFIGVAVSIVVLAAFLMYRQAPKVGKDVPETANPNELVVDNTPTPEDNVKGAMNLPKPELTIDQNKTYKAVLATTEGDITIVLNSKDTPITANNFVYLANNKFYDGTIFHRVLNGFMIQGGDPTGTGTGSPGYRFDDEEFDGEYKRGTVAMANSGPNTNGSQFFIMHADYPLPKNYVIFGNVTEGIDVVDKIATADTTISVGGEKSKPVVPVKINSVTIIEE